MKSAPADRGIKVTSGMSVVDDFSKLNLGTPEGKTATITLRQPVAVEGDFAEMQDTTKGAGVQKAMNILGGFAAMRGMGGMKFGKTKTSPSPPVRGFTSRGRSRQPRSPMPG